MRHVNQKRLLTVYIAVMLFAGLIFFKLYTIAVSDFGVILPALNDQHTRRLNIAERRGFIFDRNGGIIAGYAGLYNSMIDPSKIGLDIAEERENIYDAAERIARISNLDAESILEQLKNGVPFIIQTHEPLNNNYAQSYMTYRRDSESSSAIHILGYLDSDRQGATGIEAAYNKLLEKTGARIFAVYDSDALNKSFKGEPIRTVDYGYNNKTGLTLTLDWSLQKKIEQIADENLSKGAIVIADVETGEILASVSRPVFSLDNIADYIDSENGEFVNRAFSAFTPGSVFKTVIAAAALEINPRYLDFSYYCEGIIDISGRSFRCHHQWGHGEVADMTEAYAKSCNPYFMTLALELGYAEIYEMAKNLGVGEFGSLDGLSVSRGNIPEIISPPPALIANTAIGQGELLMTPLEAARIFCAIANGGVMPELSLVKSFIFENRNVDLSNRESRRVISEQTVDYLLDMARAVVETGTGTSAAPEFGSAAGKTSSAESGQLMQAENEDGEQEQIVHSWFAGYYPAEPERRPLYSITVIAEGGVNENVRSAAIFKEICDYLGSFLY